MFIELLVGELAAISNRFCDFIEANLLVQLLQRKPDGSVEITKLEYIHYNNILMEVFRKTEQME